jgi:hypothetical protein
MFGHGVKDLRSQRPSGHHASGVRRVINANAVFGLSAAGGIIQLERSIMDMLALVVFSLCKAR